MHNVPLPLPHKKKDKGLPGKGLWIFCRHDLLNISLKSSFC